MFITALTRACHLTLSWIRAMLSIPSKPTYLIVSFLILFSHLCLCLSSGPFLSATPFQNPIRISPFPHICHMSNIFIIFSITRKINGALLHLCYIQMFHSAPSSCARWVYVLLLAWQTNFHIHTKQEVKLGYNLFHSLRIEIADGKRKNSEFNGIR